MELPGLMVFDGSFTYVLGLFYCCLNFSKEMIMNNMNWVVCRSTILFGTAVEQEVTPALMNGHLVSQNVAKIMLLDEKEQWHPMSHPHLKSFIPPLFATRM